MKIIDKIKKYLFLRGIFAIIFSLLVFFVPQVVHLSLIYLAGFYALVEGILAIAGSFALAPLYRGWWVSLLEGIISLFVAAICFGLPQLATLSFFIILVSWVMIKCLMCVEWGLKLRKIVKVGNDLLLLGLLGLIIDLVMLSNPSIAIQSLIALLGGVALVWGVSHIVLGIRINTYSNKITKFLKQC